MANWCDVIELYSVSVKPDSAGFNQPVEGEKRIVFANSKSVGYSEFYQAHQTGITATLKFDVRTMDYQGETHLIHEGKTYKILRAYLSRNKEFTELTVTDLSTKAGV